MGAALKHIGLGDILEATQKEIDSSEHGLTTVIMNKHTGEIIKTIKYKQVLITLDVHESMEENILI